MGVQSSWPDNLTGGIGLLANLFFGFEGNNFRRRALAKRPLPYETLDQLTLEIIMGVR